MLKNVRYTAIVLLALCCTAFFRCDSTQKSMVRALVLDKAGNDWNIGLLYQAPDASADSSEANAEVKYVSAVAETLEKAFSLAENALPQSPNYRLCDHVLLSPKVDYSVLNAYDSLVLERPIGRSSAYLLGGNFTSEELLQAAEIKEDIFFSLLQLAEKRKELSPRLYEENGKDALILPLLLLREDGLTFTEEARILSRAEDDDTIILAQNTAQMFWLLKECPGTRSFWLDDRACLIRRADISVTLQDASHFVIRTDCQTAFGTKPPDPIQIEQLSALCEKTIQDFWLQGIDILGLKARTMLQNGNIQKPSENFCPEVQADIHFDMFF